MPNVIATIYLDDDEMVINKTCFKLNEMVVVVFTLIVF